jgi:hypothetical protein
VNTAAAAATGTTSDRLRGAIACYRTSCMLDFLTRDAESEFVIEKHGVKGFPRRIAGN